MQETRALIIGLGKSGKAACRYLMEQGQPPFGVDRSSSLLRENPEIQMWIEQGLYLLDEDSTIPWNEVGWVIVSPGVSREHPHYQQAVARQIPVVGEVEFAWRAMPPKKVVAITGTNGKTTVTLLVEHILCAAGKKAKAVGNIGTPLIESVMDQETDYLVVELSSYQLETMNSPVIDVGVLLNITPDHLDRYASMEEYAKAKAQMQHCLSKEGVFFVHQQVEHEWKNLFTEANLQTYGLNTDCAVYSDGIFIYFDGCKEGILPSVLQGKRTHDLENWIAAYAICRTLGISAEKIIDAYASFQKPAHRIEYVCCARGVHYVDDSKGTNLDAVVKAVNCMEGEVILIAGGVHKGVPYSPWKQAFRGKVRHICAIGEAAPLLVRDLAPEMHVELCATLDEAVERASQVARPGETVLLSPGCASFDMFRDYAHRGEEFKKLVLRELQGCSSKE